MKYSADDILQQTFEKKMFGGFAREQVREFLSALAHEWEAMTEELLRLQDDIEIQAKELKALRKRARSLLDGAVEAAKQRGAQMLFEGLDLEAEGRRRDMQFLCRLGKGHVPGSGVKGAQGSQGGQAVWHPQLSTA